MRKFNHQYFYFAALLLAFQAKAQTLDTGNGSLGNCDQNSFTTGGTYNCQSVTITGNVSISGTSAVVIKSIGEVTINATLNVDGANGQAGGTNNNGGTAGPAGFDGGDCDSGTCEVGSANTATGSGGATGGGGGVLGGDGGGGGGGGAYRTADAAGAGSAGTGVVAGAGGPAGSTFGAESNFASTFLGGGGGGAGGRGDSTSDTSRGGGGGGGGGAIRIIAGGNITIEAGSVIRSRGGNGGVGANDGGCGGGGAGGAIWLASGGQINLNNGASSLNVAGGSGGSCPGAGGDGGTGGSGRIRLDDQDGAVASAPGFAVINTAPPAPARSSGSNEITSDIACGSIAFVGDDNFPNGRSSQFLSLLLGVMLAGVFYFGFDSLNKHRR